MLAMKQQFEEVNGEAIEDQPAQDSANDINFAEAFLDDPNGQNVDMFYNRVVGDHGSEGYFAEYTGVAETVAGGKAGKGSELAEAADKNVEARNGSRETDIAQTSRVEDKVDKMENHWRADEALTLDVPGDDDPELNMPEISYMLETEDPNVAVQAIYFELAEKGVDPNEIDKAMTAGNDYDVLDALSQVAEDNGLDDVAEYGRDVQVAFAGIGVPEAIQNITPQIDQVTPAVAANDPKWELENDQPKVQTFGMG